MCVSSFSAAGWQQHDISLRNKGKILLFYGLLSQFFVFFFYFPLTLFTFVWSILKIEQEQHQATKKIKNKIKTNLCQTTKIIFFFISFWGHKLSNNLKTNSQHQWTISHKERKRLSTGSVFDFSEYDKFLESVFVTFSFKGEVLFVFQPDKIFLYNNEVTILP